MEILDLDFADEPAGLMQLRPYQVECLDAIRNGWRDYSRLLAVLSTGCFRKGTPVLMADGSILRVEKIRKGNQVMGADGSPRSVRSLARGREMMYAVIPTKGGVHYVNENHVLTLEETPKKTGMIPQVIDMRMRDYIAASSTQKHVLKLYRSKRVEFHRQNELLPLSPYFVGVFLGDGSATTSIGRWTLQHPVGITTADPEIVEEVRKVTDSFGLRMRTELQPGNKSSVYYIVGKTTGRMIQGRNAVSQLIKYLGINVECGKKFIPQAYKTADSGSRLELLAGLMDTDGSLSSSGYDYISKSRQLADDVVFLCRSLGLAAYLAPCIKSCQTGAVGLYYRVSISGDCSIVPCRIPRKVANPRRQKKSVLRTGFKVEQIGVEDYYGFELDGIDGRFLLGDFTATHNSGKTIIFSHVTQEVVNAGGKVLIIAHTDELLEQAIDQLKRSTGIEAHKEKADEHASMYAPVVVASIQSIARVSRLLSFPDNHFALVICDETHHVLAASYQRVMKYFHFGEQSLEKDWVMPEPGIPFEFKARCLGVTATADRGDKRSLGEFYQYCCYEFGLLEAVRDGWQVRPIVKNIPLKIDMRGVKKTAGDYDAGQVSERITPFLKAIAGHIAAEAHDRKTVVFLPSIETARQMALALRESGLDADFVSGACTDRSEKVTAFDCKGNGAAITCAIMLTEGWNCPSASCVVVLRLTKIRSLFVQCAGRCARTLPGVIDGLSTREERLAAIAASDKKNMLLIDFLWLTDKLDLIQPVDLVATRPEMKKAMIATGIEDLIEAEVVAERDLMKALEKAAKRHAHREARTIDPLALAVSLGDSALAHWEPETKWDSEPITPGQADFLRRHHIDPTPIKYKGLAHKVIGRLVARMRLNLATPIQLEFMTKKLGISEQECATLTIPQASDLIDRVKSERGWV